MSGPVNDNDIQQNRQSFLIESSDRPQSQSEIFDVAHSQAESSTTAVTSSTNNNNNNHKNENGPVSTANIIKLLKLEIPDWPNCSYSSNSKRRLMKYRKISYIPCYEEALDTIKTWSNYDEIAIDGMSSCGKSTIIDKSNRYIKKTTKNLKYIKRKMDYNFKSINSFEYLMYPLTRKYKNVCWDRCPFSNLIFYFVHHLLYVYQQKQLPIPVDDAYEAWSHLNNLAIDINLLSIVNQAQAIKYTPILFLVCSDIDYISLAMRSRGESSDIVNSTDYNYHVAQLQAYSYFANLLKMPIIDLAECFDHTYTLNAIQTLIIDSINTIDMETDVSDEENDVGWMINLNKLLAPISDDNMIFTYSCK